jgi:hypothetical protein
MLKSARGEYTPAEGDRWGRDTWEQGMSTSSKTLVPMSKAEANRQRMAKVRNAKRRREPDAVALARENQALELRMAAMSYEQIRQQCGYTHRSAARKAVQRALDRVRAEPIKQVREMAQARLDRALRAVWPGVLRGDRKDIELMLKIEERRAKMLGLDMADRVDIEQRVRVIAVALGMDPERAVMKAQIVLAERGA